MDEAENEIDVFLDLGGDPIAEASAFEKKKAERRLEKHERRTYPIMTKYEVAKLLGFRARQLDDNDTPRIPIDQLKSTASDKIAMQELQAKKIPLKVVRRHVIDNTYEVWEVSELTLPKF
jgi:DNA-directed RNA polymerase subunit K/omega